MSLPLKRSTLLTLGLGILLGGLGSMQGLAQHPAQNQPQTQAIPNEQIDYETFEAIVAKTGPLRESRRLSEADFLAMMAEEGVVLLDARSAQRYDQRHIAGAVSLPFTDFTAESLAAVIPSPNTPVLIYCNNNFLGDEVAFASKAAPASLNLSTFNALVAYGYNNVYELGPLLDVETTLIPFVGSTVIGLDSQELSLPMVDSSQRVKAQQG
jgi:phage shock protein E